MDFTLTSRAHSSEMVEAYRIPVQGPYLEDCWLPIVGPSTVLLARATDRLATEAGGRVIVPSAELAGMLGLGRADAVSPVSSLGRTLRRAAQFGMAEWDRDRGLFTAYAHVAPVPNRRLRHLPLRNLWLHAEEMSAVAARLAGSGQSGAHSEAVHRLSAAQKALLDRERHAVGTSAGAGPANSDAGTDAARELAALDRLRLGQPGSHLLPPSAEV